MKLEDRQLGLLNDLKISLQTKRLNFLIGSGVSIQAIGTLESFKENGSVDFNSLISKVKNVSVELLGSRDKMSSNTLATLADYQNFVNAVIDSLYETNSRQVPREVNIFTTNYDLFIERAMDELMSTNNFVFNDGTRGYFNRKLDSSNYNRTVSYKGLNDNYINEIPSVSLIKPHGSVNWVEKDDQLSVTSVVQEDCKIVQPTGQEEQDTFMNNHFHEMLRVFQLALDRAQSILCVVGFSFQDEHIAKMVRRALQNIELTVYVFVYQNEEKAKILSNLKMQSQPNNLKIVSPQLFESSNQSVVEGWRHLELSNLTKIINGEAMKEFEVG